MLNLQSLHVVLRKLYTAAKNQAKEREEAWELVSSRLPLASLSTLRKRHIFQFTWNIMWQAWDYAKALNWKVTCIVTLNQEDHVDNSPKGSRPCIWHGWEREGGQAIRSTADSPLMENFLSQGKAKAPGFGVPAVGLGSSSTSFMQPTVWSCAHIAIFLYVNSLMHE